MNKKQKGTWPPWRSGSVATRKMFQTVMCNLSEFGLRPETLQAGEPWENIQKWISWNHKRGIAASTIRVYFNSLRSFLWWNGTKLEDMDVRHRLKFPKTLYERPVPITEKQIEEILKQMKTESRFQILALISSGMRIGELAQIRKENLDMQQSIICARIPAKITKTGRSRITFFSKQVSDMIRYRIRKNIMSDVIFAGHRTPAQFAGLVGKRLAAARERAGINATHNTAAQNRYDVHVHALRAYFITKANQVQFGLGHILAGHEFYMGRYNRYTESELMEMYRRIEKSLTFGRKKK